MPTYLSPVLMGNGMHAECRSCCGRPHTCSHLCGHGACSSHLPALLCILGWRLHCVYIKPQSYLIHTSRAASLVGRTECTRAPLEPVEAHSLST